MNQIKDFLQKLSEDVRDFSHHKVYGTVKPPLVNFDVSDLAAIVLDQYDLDFCPGFGTSELNTNIQFADSSLVDYLSSRKLQTSVAYRSALALKYGLVKTAKEYMDMAAAGTNGQMNLQIVSKLMEENKDYFCPLWQFAKIKQIRGEYMGFGANLRDACLSLTRFGSLPKNKSPFTYLEHGATDHDRDWLANWDNWPLNLDMIASYNRLDSFWTCDGPFDAFDNIRSVLYTNYKAKLKVGVLFGLNWRDEWTYTPGGVIAEANYGKSEGSPHCIWLRGQVIINNMPYIILQQSGGKGIGKEGLYAFPRSVINKEFSAGFGAFTFKDLPAKTAGLFIENNIKAKNWWTTAMAKIAWNFVSDIIKPFKHD